MKVVRVTKDSIVIEPESEDEQSYLEKSLGWKEKGTLEEILAELKGYKVKE